MTHPRIAVVGGGVTGLAAAYELRDDADVTVFEATDRLGGKVLTDELDGILIEAGPDSLLARDDQAIRLLHGLGLDGDMVEPHNFGAWIALAGGLKPLPEGFVLGVPASPAAILGSGLLSPLGVVRAGADLVLPKTKIGADISVGAIVRSRFGTEVAERIVAPLMSGVRSGDIDEMSLDMAAPQIADVARSNRSLTLGLRKARESAGRPRFVGLRRGMSSLVDALREASTATIRLGSDVGVIGDDMELGGQAFDGVVVALPPPAAAPILGLPRLGEIHFASGTVINLVYPADAVPPPERGSGILFPPSKDNPLIACTWFTSKWPHTAPADGRSVIRCFARAGTTEDQVVSELRPLIGSGADPIATKVHPWDSALPEFKVGHRGLIQDVQESLRDRPIAVVGAGFLATGLNDCLLQGCHAAREVLAAARA